MLNISWKFALSSLLVAALGANVALTNGSAMPAVAQVAGHTYIVNRASDTVDANPGDGICATAGNVCTLRAAIMEANAIAGLDTITFDHILDATPIVLTIGGQFEDVSATGDLDVRDDLVIVGNGARNTIIDGYASDRVLDNFATTQVMSLTLQNGRFAAQSGAGVRNSGTLTLKWVDVVNNNTFVAPTCQGQGCGLGPGGGIENDGTLTLLYCNVSNNFGGRGGGIYNNGALFMDNSVLGNNQGDGALYNVGRASVNASSVASNLSNASTAAGIANFNTLTVTNSTLSSMYHAIENLGTARVTNSTFFSNAGAIYSYSSSTSSADLIVINSTLFGNYGVGVYHYSGVAKITNTIMANTVTSYLDNTATADCSSYATGSITITNSFLRAQSAATPCGVQNGINGNIISDNPGLGPLADNGGPTLTFAPLAGSPVIDAGSTANCPATDQRGVARPQGAACDMGAVESNNSAVPPTPSPTPTSTPIPTNLPDLSVTAIAIRYQSATCRQPGDAAGTVVSIVNAGNVNASTFVVRLNGADQTVAGLTAGQRLDVIFPAIATNANSTAIVDPLNQVAESNENNNSLTTFLIGVTFTPPPPCPTPTPSPTATKPPPTLTPSPTATKPPPTPTPSPTATKPPPTPTPIPSKNVVIYDDARAAGWDDWATNITVTWNSPSPVKVGNSAVRVQLKAPFGTLTLRSQTAVDTQALDALEFWVYGGPGGNVLTVFVQSGDASTPSRYVYFTAQPNVWQLVHIRLDAFGSFAQIKRVNIQDASGLNNTSYSLDQIVLVAKPVVGQVTDAIVYDDALTSSWLSWSYDITPTFASTSVVQSGKYALGVQVNKAWGTLALRNDAPINTVPFAALEFDVYGVGSSGKQVVFVQEGDATQPSNYVFFTAQNGAWNHIKIPLGWLGAATQIKRISIQDASGSPGAQYAVDNVRMSVPATGSITTAATRGTATDDLNGLITMALTARTTDTGNALNWRVEGADPKSVRVYQSETGDWSKARLVNTGLSTGSYQDVVAAGNVTYWLKATLSDGTDIGIGPIRPESTFSSRAFLPIVQR